MATYKPIQSFITTSAAASVTLSGIDQNYTDLVLVCNLRYTASAVGQGIGMRFNGDASTNYSATVIEGDGSSASSYRSISGTSGIFNAPSNGTQSSFSPVVVSIANYTSTTNTKTWVSRNSGPTYVNAYVGLWRATPQAITSITFVPSATAVNIDSGSTFDLYGIKSGAPQALGGDVVTTDGNYWYHAFRSTGAFIPQRNLTADVLQIAGGGGGGYTFNGGAGGGGAGGIFYATAQSLISTNYIVTVGSGGPQVYEGAFANGNDSQFGSLTLSKGGGQGGRQYGGGFPGAAGGSGGGGGGAPGGSGNAGGASTQTSTGGTGYGNAGGQGATGGADQRGGGGGGAGAAGTVGNSNGAGGAGLNTWSSWASATGTGVSGFYAGGGGGNPNGSAGSGGGGASGVAGTANTGSGGGGGTNQGSGASGGSGIVIVRYPV